MDTELEARGPRQPALMMLKEWLELESSAELSRDGFACYPRHLVAELRRNASSRRKSGDDVIARVSASLSRRLRAGFWKKKRRVVEQEEDRRVPSCSGASSSPAMSPQRGSWQGGSRASVNGAGLDSRRNHETENVAGPDCATACRLDEEREQEQRLSPVSVMDFPGQEDDEDDGSNDQTGGNGDDDDETMSPTFARSVANIQRASQVLLLKIRQFEQLAELDLSEVDAATTATEDATSCHVAESDIEDEAIQDLLGILQVSSPVPACRFQKLLEDFFREGLASSSSRCERSDDDSETARSFLLATAKSWLDGRRCTLRSDWKADMEEMERLGWWRRFREAEQKMLAVDVEGGIFWSLMEELVDDLC